MEISSYIASLFIGISSGLIGGGGFVLLMVIFILLPRNPSKIIFHWSIFLLKNILVWILLFLSNNLFSQNRNEFWVKASLIKKVDKHWAIGIDIQHRRQADYYKKDKNIFHFALTNSIRLWAYYKLKQNWSIVASPVAYFENENIVNTTGLTVHSEELRSMVGIGKNLFFQKLLNYNRLLYEIDLINFNYPGMITKHRYRLMNNFVFAVKSFDISHSLNYNFFNEVFLKTENGMTSFDQNHFYNGIQWKWKLSDFGLGYQYTYQKATINYINKNQILLSLNFMW